MMNEPRSSNAFVARSPMKPSGTATALKIIAGVFGAMVGLLLGLIVLVLVGGGEGTGAVSFLIGMISATLPVPFYLMLVLWIDRYEAEPFWMLATAFFWGALVAV